MELPASNQLKSGQQQTARMLGMPAFAAGWWQADPTDNSVLIFLVHNIAELQQMASGIGLGVWSAIAKFHELASASPHVGDSAAPIVSRM